MIGIIIIWIILGILLLISSSLMYNSNNLNIVGFLVIFSIGIVILAGNLIIFNLWQTKWKVPGKSDIEKVKKLFIVLLLLSGIITGLGALGLLLEALNLYKFDILIENSLPIILEVGSVLVILSIISWIYIEKNISSIILDGIKKQQNDLNRLKDNVDSIRTNIKFHGKDLTESVDNAKKTIEKNENALKMR